MFKFEKMENIIAADVWEYLNEEGQQVTARLEVGQPIQAPGDENGDWVTPVFVEGFTPPVATIWGVGPVDSLMNAMTLVKNFHDRHEGTIAPRFLERDEGPGHRTVH